MENCVDGQMGGSKVVAAPMQVLVAEDSPIFQRMLHHMLSKWGYDVVPASDGEEAWHLLRNENGPRLAILDWMMPGLDGVEVCRKARALGREPYTYILLLTARTERSDLVEGMEAGADDYVTKPFNAHELRVRLRAGRRILDLQEELVRAREALRRQATHDGLTGLWNRTAILEVLKKELVRGNRESTPVAVLMADLDHFKQVNDTHGHLAGDAVLQQAARRMQSGLRRYDSLGRYGGEEFLAVLPGCEGAGAVAQAERLRESFRGQSFELPGGSLAVTCSLGVSWTDAPQTDQAEALLRSADQALYLAKDHGRNRVEIAWMEAAVGCSTL
ncbi:MAG TPA: diguanylate cyclase [Bryobacteraceae bacterium]|nr:diguanylate cyclase [Bryobacteraceae bacterium]